jgi:hypothetical protein
VIVADYIVSRLIVCFILGGWPVLFILLRRGFWTPRWKPSVLVSVMGVLLSWFLMMWFLFRFPPNKEIAAMLGFSAVVILPYALIVARVVDKAVRKMSFKLKSLWVLLLLVYLVFDLRPLLLIPNLLLYRKPCAIYIEGTGAIEVRVFPRLCIAGDPIQVVIRSHDLPLGEAFGRTYDRSGIFGALQFSGTINNACPIGTLYWTQCLSGGLGGDIIPEKTIWLGDYIHFDRVGRYRINLRYQDSIFEMNAPMRGVDYNLGSFSLIYLPENPISKTLKQVVLAAGMFVPSDDYRALAVKWLGYQETAFSTYALGKYHSLYGHDISSNDPHANSVFETYRGTLRNYDYRTVGRILSRVEQGQRNSLLGSYFHLHCCRLIIPLDTQGEPISAEVTEAKIAHLIKCTYPGVDQSSKDFFMKTANNLRDQETDEYWHTLIDKLERKEAAATNQTEIAHLSSRKQWAETRLADKKERDLRLRLIDYTLAHLPEQDRKNAETGTNTVSRIASQ